MSSNFPFNFSDFFESEEERNYNLSYTYRPTPSSLVSVHFSYNRSIGDVRANARPRARIQPPLSPVDSDFELDDNSHELLTLSNLTSPLSAYEPPRVRTSTRATHHRQRCETPNCTGFAVTPLPCHESRYEKMCFFCRYGPKASKAKDSVKAGGNKASGNKRPLVVNLVGDDKSKSKLEKPKECPICAEDDVPVRVIKPCGHWMCEGCMVNMTKMECPYCRCKDIKLPKEVLTERRKKPRLV